MKIYIAADHAGFQLKEVLGAWLVGLGHQVIDAGAFKYDADDDYPDFISKVAYTVVQDLAELGESNPGIVIGGSGQGEMMVANKVEGIRAALFYGPVLAKGNVDREGRESTDPYEIARLARLHNNANILVLSARFMTTEEAQKAVQVFLDTEFKGEERHVRRIEKMREIEEI